MQGTMQSEEKAPYIYLLEDDLTLSREIRQFAINHGFSCLAQDKKYDLYILDINIPGMNGIQICERIRQADREAPILMLTAYSDVKDKVNAFNAGADDYLVKPFHFDELLARIQALLRRKNKPLQQGDILRVHDMVVNIPEATVERSGQIILLSPKEFKLLTILAQADGKVVSKSAIAEKLWEKSVDTSHNTIEVYINFLRRKIDKGHANRLIQTRPGFGYFLKAE
jgi:DNA-binding response OmpR family regulator